MTYKYLKIVGTNDNFIRLIPLPISLAVGYSDEDKFLNILITQDTSNNNSFKLNLQHIKTFQEAEEIFSKLLNYLHFTEGKDTYSVEGSSVLFQILEM